MVSGALPWSDRPSPCWPCSGNPLRQPSAIRPARRNEPDRPCRPPGRGCGHHLSGGHRRGRHLPHSRRRHHADGRHRGGGRAADALPAGQRPALPRVAPVDRWRPNLGCEGRGGARAHRRCRLHPLRPGAVGARHRSDRRRGADHPPLPGGQRPEDQPLQRRRRKLEPARTVGSRHHSAGAAVGHRPVPARTRPRRRTHRRPFGRTPGGGCGHVGRRQGDAGARRVRRRRPVLADRGHPDLRSGLRADPRRDRDRRAGRRHARAVIEKRRARPPAASSPGRATVVPPSTGGHPGRRSKSTRP